MANDETNHEPDEVIDHALLRTLTRRPMTPDEWQQLLDRHAQFLDSCQSRRSGTWQVLIASGLPLAVWDGVTAEAGQQLNVNLANLCGLSLEWACIPCAALPGVMAERVSFRGAELSHSLLTDAALDHANFEIARLEHADFSRASLRGACFAKALLIQTDFEDCDLRGADFRGAKFERTRFEGAQLEGALGLPDSTD